MAADRRPPTEIVAEPPVAPVNAPAAQPIYQTTAYAYDDLETVRAVYQGEAGYYAYTREAHPNQESLEYLIANLEGAEAAAVTGAGMAAITGSVLACARAGDHVVASADLYGGTVRLFRDVLPSLGIQVNFVDLSDPERLGPHLRPQTRVVYVETVSNPTMRVVDLAAVVDIARRAGSEARVVVDNTFATPYACRPLAVGADLVVHSLSKFLAGHHDVIGGVVAGSRALIQEVKALSAVMGWAAAPFNAWLATRGLRTLWLRMEKATASAQRLAAFLSEHPRVVRVYYPGLASHPDHAVASRLLAGKYGAMLAFELDGGLPEADRFLRALRTIRFLPTLGGVATNVSHPATTSHRMLSAEQRRQAGIADGLVRLSVGIEDVDDLVADLDQALAAR